MPISKRTMHWFRIVAITMATICMTVYTAACSDLSGLAGKQEIPAGLADPNTFDNPDGSVAWYNGALCQLQQCNGSGLGKFSGTFIPFIRLSGLLSDELQSAVLGGSSALQYTTISSSLFARIPIDARQIPEGFAQPAGTATYQGVFSKLQQLRSATNQAIGALAIFGTGTSPALRGEMFAIQGYADLMLAELYCSGVPLSTLDYKGNYTYQPGSTSVEIYQRAKALLDSAIALSSDSVRVLNLARVGKARAFLDLGQYDSAGITVAEVPTSFIYGFGADWSGNTSTPVFSNEAVTIADREGTNGIAYLSSQDPRTRGLAYGLNQITKQDTLYFPAKYGPLPGSVSTVRLADGIEARLIQAEAALQANDITTWLATLNTLRTTCTTTTDCPSPAPAGTGGIAGLSPLYDPGVQPLPAGKTAFDVRVDLLFRERAYWLFLTGHRQGDLRRLVRSYHRLEESVYPTGTYAAPGVQVRYGSDTNLPIPPEERRNPKFSGCLDREA